MIPPPRAEAPVEEAPPVAPPPAVARPTAVASPPLRSGSVQTIPAAGVTPTRSGFEVNFGGGSIPTPMVYGRALVFTGGFTSRAMYAVQAKTGAPIWSLALSDSGPSSPVCDDGVCVVNTESCTVFAVAADTGAMLWSYWLGDPMVSAPTIAHGRAFTSFASAGAHVLAAFDLTSGAPLWRTKLDGAVVSAPVAAGHRLWVTTFMGTIAALDATSGEIAATWPTVRASAAPLVTREVGGEHLYYAAAEPGEDRMGGEVLVHRDLGARTVRWSTAPKRADYLIPTASVSAMQAFQGSRSIRVDDRIVTTMGDEVIATETKSGIQLWSYKLPGDVQKTRGPLGSAPIAAGDSVLFGTLAGDIVRLDAVSGRQLATYAVGHPVRQQPVVADGWIYAGTEDGRLVAIDTKDPKLTGWSTWGGNAQRTGAP